MNKIGLMSDSINFPSLPLMKISAFHKEKGDIVKSVNIALEKFDVVYISKVFNLNLSNIPKLNYLPLADKYIFGGTGYAIEIENGKEIYKDTLDKPLPTEIEYAYPDYSLFPELTNDIAYGFLTRGCPNNCQFCIVSKKEGLCSRKVADLSQFWNGQKFIKLLDANILACKERENLFIQLIKSKASIDYTQGLDVRLIDEDIAKLITQTKVKMVHFAFDLMKNEKAIINGLKIFSKYYQNNERSKRVYILTNFNTTLQEDYYRVKRVKELGYTPYVMIYRKGTHPKFLTDLARWSNNMLFQYSTSFEDYIPRKDGKSIKNVYKNILQNT